MSTAQQEVIPAAEVAAKAAERKSLIRKFADRFNVEPNKMVTTLKATAFRQRPGDPEVTDEQLMALLIVADQYGLNPWTKEIHAFRDKMGGIVPVVGIDGWARIINEHPQFDGMDFEQSEAMKKADDNAKECPEWIECVMHRKDRQHPIRVREYLDEVYRPAYVKNGTPILGPWQTHTKRFMRHKTVIQAARLAFGFVGIYDQDEAERIVEAPLIDVTPPRDDEPQATKPKKIGPRRMREYCERIDKLLKAEDGSGLIELLDELSQEEYLQIWEQLRSWERTAFKKLEEAAKSASCGIGLDKWSIETLKGAKDLKGLEVVRDAIEKAYDDNGQEPPAAVLAVYEERKAALEGSK